jgi:hypothetical protein
LGEYIIHRLARRCVAPSEQPEQAQYFHLKEGIGDAANIVFWAEAGRDEIFEVLDQKARALRVSGRLLDESMRSADLAEFCTNTVVELAHLGHEGDPSEQDSVVPVLKQRLCFRGEVVHQVWHASDHSKRTQCGLQVSDDLDSHRRS